MACTAEELEFTGVQEMVEREQLLAVPPAFIRPLQDRPLLSSLHSDDQLPIIDVSGLLSPLTRPQLLKDISFASTHWGFFQAINHGVRDEVVAEMRAACLRFFNQPAKERNKGMAAGSTIPPGQATGRAWSLLRLPLACCDQQPFPTSWSLGVTHQQLGSILLLKCSCTEWASILQATHSIQELNCYRMALRERHVSFKNGIYAL